MIKSFLPSKNYDNCLTAAEFSPNIVQIKISAPGYPNLSFYDLPGLVGQTKQSHVVKLIGQLVHSYIKNKNSMVLLVLPLAQKIEKSWALGVARQEKAAERALGILTKPDRLRNDDPVDGWNKVLANDSQAPGAYPLGHGYYVTKQPDTRDSAVLTWEDARREEEEFFSSFHWGYLFPAVDAERLGTHNLTCALSEKLGDLITNSLPGITTKVNKRLELIERELQMLPATTASPGLVLS
jgi:hypothetical protein